MTATTDQLRVRESVPERRARRPLVTRVPLVAWILVFFAVVAILGPYIAPHDYARAAPTEAMKPPVGVEGADWAYPLGTDPIGRDTLSRIIQGSRASLGISAAALAIAASFGTSVGLVAGYLGGRWGDFLMRITDIALAMPTILIALFIIAIFGPSITNLILAMAVTMWPLFARQIRGEAVSVMRNAYVEAALATGAGPGRVIFRHVFPNVRNTLIVLVTLGTGTAILLESALSFLGLGVQAPQTSWGLMLSQGRDWITSAWWLVTIPGIFIAITVLCVNLLGDWLRDYFDPHLKRLE